MQALRVRPRTTSQWSLGSNAKLTTRPLKLSVSYSRCSTVFFVWFFTELVLINSNLVLSRAWNQREAVETAVARPWEAFNLWYSSTRYPNLCFLSHTIIFIYLSILWLKGNHTQFWRPSNAFACQMPSQNLFFQRIHILQAFFLIKGVKVKNSSMLVIASHPHP